MCMCVPSPQLCLTLCDPMDCSSPDSSVRGILQARILEWVAISSFRDPPDSGIKPVSPALAGGFYYHQATWERMGLGEARQQS